jgi:hypothetical protein
VDPALRDVEVNAVESDDFAKALGDPARTNGKRPPGSYPPGGRVVIVLRCCAEARQCVSGLGR